MNARVRMLPPTKIRASKPAAVKLPKTSRLTPPRVSQGSDRGVRLSDIGKSSFGGRR
jgi:hypothetical protein